MSWDIHLQEETSLYILRMKRSYDNNTFINWSNSSIQKIFYNYISDLVQKILFFLQNDLSPRLIEKENQYESFNMNVKPSKRICEVKKQIEKKTGIPTINQK